MWTEGGPSRWAKAYIALVAFSLLGSLASSAFKLDPGWIKPVAGLLTLGFGVIALLEPILRQLGGRETANAVLPVLLVGIGSEICGLYTGLPFGRYQYTSEWWPVVSLPGNQVFPLQLPFAWFMIATAAYLLFVVQLSRPLAIVAASLTATLVDLPMEWVMVRFLGYWTWTDPSWPIGDVGFGVPWMNSVGWLVTTGIAVVLLDRHGVHQVNGVRSSRIVLVGHLALMLGIALIGLAFGTSAPPIK